MDWQKSVLQIKERSKGPLWNNETFWYRGTDQSLDQLLVDFAINNDSNYPSLRQEIESEITKLKKALSKTRFVELIISRIRTPLEQDGCCIMNHMHYNSVIKFGCDAVKYNPTISFRTIIPGISQLKQQLLSKEGVESLSYPVPSCLGPDLYKLYQSLNKGQQKEWANDSFFFNTRSQRFDDVIDLMMIGVRLAHNIGFWEDVLKEYYRNRAESIENIAENLFSTRFANSSHPGMPELSDEDKRIINLIKQNTVYADIASILNYQSDSTIKARVKKIKNIIGAKSKDDIKKWKV